MNLLSYRAAAAILRCSHQTVGNLLRSGTLANLRRETVTALAQTYQPRNAHAPGPGRPRGARDSIRRSSLAILLPNGQEVRGWNAASAALDMSRHALYKRATWRDGRYVIRERS